ncbi:MAG: hypothetical protein A2V66_09985 [Ignavibacteria bacterium RBG_13_36_8]|nr:MAG: hypothetical protein A2V66_09985 [Ignavibacteria bacterium RBG_13_36_8]
MKKRAAKSKIRTLMSFIILTFSILIFSSRPIHAYDYTWDPGTGTLTITLAGALGEVIIVCRCLGGDVTLNGAWPKDGNGNDVHIATVNVRKLIINGGPGPDGVDLTCVDQTTYPNLAKTGDEFKVQINGGDGNDEIYGSGHATEVNAGAGHDYVETYEGDDKINAGDGDDEVWSGEGNDEINGDGGDDELDGEEGDDTVNGGDGEDDLYGGDGNDVIHGGDGNDYLFGDHETENDGGADELYGDAGNDRLALDFDDAVTDGGSGDDKVLGIQDMFSIDWSTIPKLLTLTDPEGNDELDFSLGTKGLKINLDLLNISQELNSFGYNLRLNGQFESLTGTPQDDEITLKGIPNFTRRIVCGLQLNADILNFDAEGQVIIDNGMALTTTGQEVLVEYEGVEIVNILNPATNADSDEEVPKQYALNQNYPNPFNPSTTISYTLPEAVNVTLKIYDSLGNEVAVLVNEEQPAGSHEINFDAANLTSGVYFYRLEAGYYSHTKAMLLLK